MTRRRRGLRGGSSRWWRGGTSSAAWSPLRWPRRTPARRPDCPRSRPARRIWIILMSCQLRKYKSHWEDYLFSHGRLINISHMCARWGKMAHQKCVCWQNASYLQSRWIRLISIQKLLWTGEWKEIELNSGFHFVRLYQPLFLHIRHGDFYLNISFFLFSVSAAGM